MTGTNGYDAHQTPRKIIREWIEDIGELLRVDGEIWVDGFPRVAEAHPEGRERIEKSPEMCWISCRLRREA